MSLLFSNHVPSKVLDEAAQRGNLDGLRESERRHVKGCAQCKQLYGGYRLADRLLAAPWQEVKLPAEAVAQPTSFPLFGKLRLALAGSLSLHVLIPVGLAFGLAAVVGVGVVLPQLLPTPAPSIHPLGTAISQPSTAAPKPTPKATPKAPSTKPQPTPSKRPCSGGATPRPTPANQITTIAPRSTASIGGVPIAWSPDGRHLLVASSGRKHQILIRDAAGRLTGRCDGDDATWVDSNTVAVATRSGRDSEATVSLVGTNGHRKMTLPGDYTESQATMAMKGGMLIGSGRGSLAIANQGGGHFSELTYVVWNGSSLSQPHSGVPLSWSVDGRKLAVLETGRAPAQQSTRTRPLGGARAGGDPEFAGGAVNGGSFSGSLQVISGGGLGSVTTVSGRFTVSAGSPVYGYGLDAIFSPDGRRLLVSGVLVDLSTRTSRKVGQGEWLPNGTLITTNGSAVLRWSGTHSSVESRLPGGGVIETSRRGDLLEYFNDGRAPIRITSNGSVQRISLSGVAGIYSLLLSPDGKAIALNGHASGGSPVAIVATLE